MSTKTPKKPNIIFLDVDGVLNTYGRIYGADDLIRTKTGHISKTCMAHLNKFIADTDSEIVLSSTWRKHGMDEAYQSLRDGGLTKDILDITPDFSHCGGESLRGNEILAWIKYNSSLVGNYNEYYNYIILDDDSDMLYWQRDQFFLVDGTTGLTSGIAYRAARYLNKFKK